MHRFGRTILTNYSPKFARLKESERLRIKCLEDDKPFVSIHLACHSEPPQLVIETIQALLKLDYPQDKLEIIVIDNNTRDPSLWEPIRDFCSSYPNIIFRHFDFLHGAKSGALNVALSLTNQRATVIGTVDADYIVSPHWLKHYVGLLKYDDVAYVQLAQDDRDSNDSLFKWLSYLYYFVPLRLVMPLRNEDDASFTIGPMSLISKKALLEVGGWDDTTITEDYALGMAFHEAGYKGYYFPVSAGKGIMPESFFGFKQQRFRWHAGPFPLFLKKWKTYLPWSKATELSWAQKKCELKYISTLAKDARDTILGLMTITAASIFQIQEIDITIPSWVICSIIACWGFKLYASLTSMTELGLTLKEAMQFIFMHNSLHYTRIAATLTGIFGKKLTFERLSKFKEQQGNLFKAVKESREETLLATIYLFVGLWLVTGSSGLTFSFYVGGYCVFKSMKFLSSLIVAYISQFKN